jgi:hypothetical protein
LESRLVDARKAAAYCGLTVAGFKAWLRRIGIRVKVPRANKYDLRALDIALNRINGIDFPVVPVNNDAVFNREMRKANRDAISSSRHEHGQKA